MDEVTRRLAAALAGLVVWNGEEDMVSYAARALRARDLLVKVAPEVYRSERERLRAWLASKGVHLPSDQELAAFRSNMDEDPGPLGDGRPWYEIFEDKAAMDELAARKRKEQDK
jgi:hypothetical protein